LGPSSELLSGSGHNNRKNLNLRSGSRPAPTVCNNKQPRLHNRRT
jgi:hypothetical protein